MQLGFVLIAHDQPEHVTRLVDRLTAQGGIVALHWDRRHPLDLVKQLRETLPQEQAQRIYGAERVAVHWGLWSVVQATLNGLEALAGSNRTIDYVTLLSGHDYPLRPLDQLRSYLAANPDIEHIECVDHEKGRWVTDGLQDERWQYRHYISWGTHPWWFDRCWQWQRTLGMNRKPLDGFKPHFGSQWWTLSWPTLEKVLRDSRDPKVRGFFRRTWVPDEMFFQTLVARAVPATQISGSGLNFYHFTPRGIPLVFHNDHTSFLAAQPHFFARKISPRANKLRSDLDKLALSRAKEELPMDRMAKQLADYQAFESLSETGLANRRIVGRQKDPWWGDMEHNNRPYTAIVASEGADLSFVWKQFTAPEYVCCGDLFSGRADPQEGAYPHPLYPEGAHKLRDFKHANFLFDIIQRHPHSHVVLSIRLPHSYEVVPLLAWDPLCDMVIVRPDTKTPSAPLPAATSWQYEQMERQLADIVWAARKAGKRPQMLSAAAADQRSATFSIGAPDRGRLVAST